MHGGHVPQAGCDSVHYPVTFFLLIEPCSSPAGRQLPTSSAGIIEIQPGYDVIAGLYFYSAR